MSFSDYIDCDIDFIEVLIEFDELKKYSEFLESHLVWPKRVELQKIDKSEDYQDYIQAIEAIEHKYSIVLPLRFSYSYIIQFCSTLEWALAKILAKKKVTIKIDKKSSKISQLLKYVDEKLNIKINNFDDIDKIIKARNLIAHSNGRVDESEICKWNGVSLYEPIEVFSEFVLQIDNKEFFRIYSESRSWLVKCCIA